MQFKINIKSFLKNKDNKKLHLLIVGNDLKFIEPAVKYLKKQYHVKIFKVKGKKWQNEVNDFLDWADIVFCEWLGSYAKWFADNKRDSQKLFIRAHRYEIIKNYGYEVDFDKVDGVITINYFLLELFSNVFSIPREKMFLSDNFIETSIYKGVKNDDFRTNIALVGYSPSLKGYKRALIVLNNLIQKDDSFKLYIIGKDYTQMHWANYPSEHEYFEDCEKFIKMNHLSHHIVNRGWINRNKMFSNIGYVLSVSDFEGSHVSITEAFSDFSIGVLRNWPGVEYVYPKELIFDNLDDMSNFILDTYNNDEYYDMVEMFNDYFVAEFNEKQFVDGLKRIFDISGNPKLPYYDLINFKEFNKKYITHENKIDTDKLLKDFKNSFLVDNEEEIKDILSKNQGKKVVLFLSDNFENHIIKNIYQKYASDKCLIYSIYFYENLDEAETFIQLCNKIHRKNVSLN